MKMVVAVMAVSMVRKSWLVLNEIVKHNHNKKVGDREGNGNEGGNDGDGDYDYHQCHHHDWNHVGVLDWLWS